MEKGKEEKRNGKIKGKKEKKRRRNQERAVRERKDERQPLHRRRLRTLHARGPYITSRPIVATSTERETLGDTRSKCLNLFRKYIYLLALAVVL